MKHYLRLFWAINAVAALSLAATVGCGSDDDDDGGSTGGTTSGGSGGTTGGTGGGTTGGTGGGTTGGTGGTTTGGAGGAEGGAGGAEGGMGGMGGTGDTTCEANDPAEDECSEYCDDFMAQCNGNGDPEEDHYDDEADCLETCAMVSEDARCCWISHAQNTFDDPDNLAAHCGHAIGDSLCPAN